MSRPLNTLVGQEIERTEDFRFLRGTGTFTDDYEPAGTLHAAILRASVAHGTLRGIDKGAALRMPGVHAVLDVTDIIASGIGTIPTIPLRLAPIEGFEKYLQPVIANGTVRYVGEPIAVVIADSRAIAEDALEAIGVDIEALGAVADWRVSKTDKILLFERNGTNIAASYKRNIGDTEKAFASAEYVRKESFRAHRHTAVPMETRGVIAHWHAAEKRLVVHGGTKVNFFNRRALAKMLGLGEHEIEMIELDVGAGFGVRGEFYPEDFLIPFAARHIGRPIKWIEDRREHLMSINHSREMDCDLEIACDRDGKIRGIRGKIFCDMGAYIRTNGGVVPAKAAQFLHGPYRIPTIEVEVAAFMTSKTPVGTLRAPGRFEANFFRERLMDMAARDLDVDPVAFRKKNLITEAELPYSIGQLVPYETETAYDTGDYHAAFDRCLTEIGWEEKRPMQGQRVRRPISGHCGRALRRKRRRGPARECAHDDRGRRYSYHRCRLFCAWTGARNRIRADRRRCLVGAVRPSAHPARVNLLGRGGLRHLSLACGCNGRICDLGGGKEAARPGPPARRDRAEVFARRSRRL